jgi:hypothetical protein
MNIIKAHNANLPVRNNLMLILIYASSLVITVLMAVASITGLIFHSKIYPTEELLRTCVPNDVVNLFIGLPILIGSMWLAWRGSLLGLLFWPGALFYVFYNAIGYVFALSSNAVFLMQLIIAALSVAWVSCSSCGLSPLSSAPSPAIHRLPKQSLHSTPQTF